MTNQTVHREAQDRQERAVEYTKLVSGKWLSQETGIPLSRIYRIRSGRAGNLTHVEVETIIAALFINQ